jgi:hypothetical protein
MRTAELLLSLEDCLIEDLVVPSPCLRIDIFVAHHAVSPSRPLFQDFFFVYNHSSSAAMGFCVVNVSVP